MIHCVRPDELGALCEIFGMLVISKKREIGLGTPVLSSNEWTSLLVILNIIFTLDLKRNRGLKCKN